MSLADGLILTLHTYEDKGELKSSNTLTGLLIIILLFSWQTIRQRGDGHGYYDWQILGAPHFSLPRSSTTMAAGSLLEEPRQT